MHHWNHIQPSSDVSPLCADFLDFRLAQVLEQNRDGQNGAGHPESDPAHNGQALAERVVNGTQATTSGRSSEPEGEVLLELDNAFKAFGSKKILQACVHLDHAHPGSYYDAPTDMNMALCNDGQTDRIKVLLDISLSTSRKLCCLLAQTMVLSDV